MKDRTAAIPGRYDQGLLEDLSSLPGYINAPNADMDAWLDQIRKLLMDKLSQGPILV